jgi:hypothetical protein
MLPARRPRLLAQRVAERVTAERVAEEQRARERDERKAAEAIERDRARKRGANTPLAGVLETAVGWILSIVGALIVSLVLTWLVRHPQALDALSRGAWSVLHLR